MSEYTKTPWEIGYGDGISGDVASWGCYLDEVECHEVVIRSGAEAVAIIYYGDPDSKAETNARHIVHCVNSHGRLVEALVNMVKPHGGTKADIVAALDVLEELDRLP